MLSNFLKLFTNRVRCRVLIDRVLLAGIVVLVVWNAHKFYKRAQEGVVVNPHVNRQTTARTIVNVRPTSKVGFPPTPPPLTSKMPAATRTNILVNVSTILANIHDVNEKNGQYLRHGLTSPNVCRRHDGQADDVMLVILVTSRVSNFKTRQNWRNSIEIRRHDNRVRVLFVMEKPPSSAMEEQLRVEHKKFGDVITLNFAEDTRMAESWRCVAGLRWVQNFCPQTGFVFIVGINTMVMVSTLLEYVDNLPPNEKENLYTGAVIHRNAWVQRSGEWGVSDQEWPSDHYPDYVQFSGILLSGKAASLMADASKKNAVFRIPDVYLGILANKSTERIFAVAPYSGFKALPHWNANNGQLTNYCSMKQFIYVYHSDPRQDMQSGWDTLRKRKELLCPT